MNVYRTRSFAFALIVALAATPAGAEPYQPSSSGGDVQQKFFTALRSVAISDDQRSVIRGIIGDGYLNGQSDREIDDRVVAVLDAGQVRALHDRLGYDPSGAGAYAPDRPPLLVAVVHKMAGNAITLTNGRTVFLRDSTHFTPSRDAIKAGVRIGIDGQTTQGGNVNADAVGAFDESFNGNFDAARATSGGRFARIVATSKSSITLENGKTAFLRDDTIVAPSRAQLQSGVKIVLYGVPTADGNVNADRVDILTRN